MVEIGERLREERVRIGMNQTDFGHVGGVTRKTQSVYESGERSPDADYLRQVSHLIDVTYVVTGNRMVATELAPDEAALIDNYRHLCDEQKKSFYTVGEAMSASYRVERKKGGTG